MAPTGPFGERIPEHAAPINAAVGTSNDYLGAHRKASETDYIIQPVQMGARVYIPELGRFLQVDPIEGGTPNNYVYPPGPMNQLDVNGKFSLALGLPWAMVAMRAATVVVSTVAAAAASPVVMTSAVVGLGAVAITKAYVDARSQSQARSNTRGYTLAPPPFPGIKSVGSGANNAVQKNTAIAFTVTQLEKGIKPGGFPTHGEFGLKELNNPMFSFNWTKYSVPYPAYDFEIHYSLNESTRQYSDVKVKKLYSGN